MYEKSYYQRGLMFHMRDFISKVIARYIESIQDGDEPTEGDELENVRKVLHDLEVWLFRTTGH